MKLFLLLFLFNYCNCFNKPYIELKSKITDISYIQGIKHLHTPEHIKYTHKISAPYFTIHSVNKPFYHNNISNIYFTCSVMNFNKMCVRMHSKTINKCEMNFFIKNKDFMTLDVSILPDTENKKIIISFLN